MSAVKPCFIIALLSFSISCLADSNTADLIQDGENNTATIEQLETTLISQAAIRQSGNNNIGYIQQGSENASTANLYQEGTDNDARLYQAGNGTQSHIELQQQGQGNQANIAFGESHYSNNFSGMQLGNYNAIEVQGGYDAYGAINQKGDRNGVLLSLSGSAGVDQTGNDNYASVNASNEGELSIVQEGSTNELLISQIAYSGGELIGTTVGNSNVVNIEQRGEYQVSLRYVQQGDGNQLAIQQGSWLGGYVDVTQNGNNNLLSASLGGGAGALQGETEGDSNRVEATQWVNFLHSDRRCQHTSSVSVRYV